MDTRWSGRVNTEVDLCFQGEACWWLLSDAALVQNVPAAWAPAFITCHQFSAYCRQSQKNLMIIMSLIMGQPSSQVKPPCFFHDPVTEPRFPFHSLSPFLRVPGALSFRPSLCIHFLFPTHINMGVQFHTWSTPPPPLLLIWTRGSMSSMTLLKF